MSHRAASLASIVLVTALAPAAPASTDRLRERSFEFVYKAAVTNIPEGARKVAVWLPYPTADRNQDIMDVRVRSPYPTALHKDPEYGNAILYVDVENPKDRGLELELAFTVMRREYVRRADAKVTPPAGRESPEAMKRWLEPDALVPLDDFVRKLGREVTAGKTTDLEKARAIYDHVVGTMNYDKTGTGWGNGDLYYACNVKKGNCTDFHALFIGLARAVGIPAKFAIGFPLPEGKAEGEIGGYHCWAEFHVEGIGWIPVDASEASKNPQKKEYFFGAHDENRVQLTIGRDILLDPPQAGKKVNYFIYPYVEVDGKPFTQVEKKFTFRDLAAVAASGE